jgi:hypothetical protein
MVGGIFHPLDARGFNRLIFIGQLFYTLVVRIFNNGEALQITRLSGALRPNFARVSAQLIGGCFIALRTCLLFPILTHESSSNCDWMPIKGAAEAFHGKLRVPRGT